MTQAGMSDDVSLNTREWDYTQQAPYYHLRPNYADGAVDHLVRHVKPILYLLWGGASFVLLIGCMNVANLALVRARARGKEMATRLALGAPPWQLARQLVVEGVVLTGAAAGAGLLLGRAALRAASAFDFQDLPYGTEIRLDAASALYALGLSLAIGIVMALEQLGLATAVGLTAFAITFGDLDDPSSGVSRLARDKRSSRLLEELGTRPQVYYLAEG